jgi:hypothetical protein
VFHRPIACIAVAAALFVAAPALQAMTYVPMTDEALADQSPGTAVVKVLAVQTGHTNLMVTDYTVEVERLLKGDLPSQFVIRLPEGQATDGSGRIGYGLPRFRVGEKAIVFVERRSDGTYGLMQLTLGAFHGADRNGQELALRDMSEATAIGPNGNVIAAEEQARDFNRFADWLATRAESYSAASDYMVKAPAPTVVNAPYTFLSNARWFEFDTGDSVTWKAHVSGLSGMPGGGFTEFQQALAAWNNDPATPINLVYGGTTTATAGSGDGINAILFDDPFQDIPGSFICGQGGILAYGGPRWSFASLPFKGNTYAKIVEGDIVTQDGAGCSFSQSGGKKGAEIFTHELGHTLALGHSCEQTTTSCPTELAEATMNWFVHNDGRGAVLGNDDRAAIALLYGQPRPQTAYNPFFAVDLHETPYVGDFNGDGKTDLITFTRDNPASFGDVYVSLSLGTSFQTVSSKWHDFFAISTAEQVVIGDYNGDGKDDVGTWLSNTSRQFYVALSQGNGMGTATVWANSIGTSSSDVLFAGDVNGDGKKDLIAFARTEGKVYVAISNGTTFGTPTVWHNFFAVSTYERPRVGDLNGDGRADIITFATDSPTAFGDVYVAVSNGTQFVNPANNAPNSSDKWHDFFAIRPTEEVRVGRLDADARQDFFTFLPMPFGQCYTALSQGTAMAGSVEWREHVVFADTDKPFVGDVNGDGRADVIIFAQSEGKVYVSLAP